VVDIDRRRIDMILAQRQPGLAAGMSALGH